MKKIWSPNILSIFTCFVKNSTFWKNFQIFQKIHFLFIKWKYMFIMNPYVSLKCGSYRVNIRELIIYVKDIFFIVTQFICIHINFIKESFYKFSIYNRFELTNDHSTKHQNLYKIYIWKLYSQIFNIKFIGFTFSCGNGWKNLQQTLTIYRGCQLYSLSLNLTRPRNSFW